MSFNNEEIRSKCKLTNNSFDVPIYYIDSNGDIIYENQLLSNPFFSNNKEGFLKLLDFEPNKVYRYPVIKKLSFLERYILISDIDQQHNHLNGTIIAGPILAAPLSEDTMNNIINDSQSFFNRDHVEQYYKSISILEAGKINSLCLSIYYLFNNELITSDFIMNSHSESQKINSVKKDINLAFSKNLQSHVFHHDLLFEKKLLYLVREGKIEELKSFIFLKKEEEAISILSKSSYLRSIKNHLITMITLVSRASIEGGVHHESAFSLHGSFIRTLEEMNHLDEVRALAREVLYTYAQKVKKEKNKRYSKTISICINFIYKHIYEDFTHNDVADHVELNPKYLSKLFKDEVGMPISDFIQEEKIKEAKRLLAYSKKSLSEIALLLNFNDQSYFSRVFKKVAGITPKIYREEYLLLEKKE